MLTLEDFMNVRDLKQQGWSVSAIAAPSGVTSKPAIEGHFKTGQRTITLDEPFLPYWLAI